jgi:hypothetical protein
VDYWVNGFEDGKTNEDVIAGFVGSVENFNEHHDNINLWLENAYKSILNWDIDVAGMHSWDSIL